MVGSSVAAKWSATFFYVTSAGAVPERSARCGKRQVLLTGPQVRRWLLGLVKADKTNGAAAAFGLID
jgi:hypothetical protein